MDKQTFDFLDNKMHDGMCVGIKNLLISSKISLHLFYTNKAAKFTSDDSIFFFLNCPKINSLHYDIIQLITYIHNLVNNHQYWKQKLLPVQEVHNRKQDSRLLFLLKYDLKMMEKKKRLVHELRETN